MFKLTPAAATALTSVRDQAGKPETYGVRFFSPAEPAVQDRLSYDFVDSPEPSDSVHEDPGISTFVAPNIDRLVGDAVVDIETVGDQSGLVLRPLEEPNASATE